jgi:pimeloyl-ACP methyl ester carboxylesterase
MHINKNQVLAAFDHSKKPIVFDTYCKENGVAKEVIIFCHGYKGFKDWGAWHLVAEAFAEAGFFFLKFNFSHNGGTVKQPIDFPDLEAFAQNNYTKELDDVHRVLDLITTKSSFKNEVDVSKINLIGHSRGGGIVLIKAQEDPRVRRVVTWAGVSDYKARFQEDSTNFHDFKKHGMYYVQNARTKQQMPHYWQFYTNFIENKKRLTIQRAAQELGKPMLIVHGDQDTTVLLQEAQKVHQWCSSSELFLAPRANHVFNAKHPYLEATMPKALAGVVAKTVLFLRQKF